MINHLQSIISIKIPPHTPTQSINHTIKKANISQRSRRKLRNDGVFLLNGKACTWDTLVHCGDTLQVFLPTESSITSWTHTLDIIYEDEHLLIINKPSGLLMHPTSTVRDKTLANAVMHYYESTKQSYDFHPVHRLDKDTSGIVVLAKTARVQHLFTKQHITFHKVYDAIVEGHMPLAQLAIHWPIARKERSIIERCVHKNGKAAHTDVTVIKTGAMAKPLCNDTISSGAQPYTHIRCILHTGRTHQIRVHLSHLGYPLLGDDIYGGHLNVIQRQALHASELWFAHPVTGEELHLHAELPNDLKNILVL